MSPIFYDSCYKNLIILNVNKRNMLLIPVDMHFGEARWKARSWQQWGHQSEMRCSSAPNPSALLAKYRDMLTPAGSSDT